jgi:hypothetical protein
MKVNGNFGCLVFFSALLVQPHVRCDTFARSLRVEIQHAARMGHGDIRMLGQGICG